MTARGLAALSDELDREVSVRAIAAGKAAVGMARAVTEVFGSRLVAGVMTASGETGPGSGWLMFPATHPQPSAASEQAGRAALALADRSRQENGVLIVCLSGGASAMLSVPAPGLTIDDKSTATRRLLLAGLNIGELNVVRRHLSAIKGGQLAARAGRSITLAISDVCTPVEDDPKVIGSGPTAGDDSTFAEALEVIERHHVGHELPAAVMTHLRAGGAGEVDGPVASSDPRLARAAYWLVASRQDAMRAAADTARALGYHVHIQAPPLTGEARLAGPRLLSGVAAFPRPACLISSGETTVLVRGAGRGGRNQELALAAMERLSELHPAALASIGTDGVDGPTDAAGAFVGSEAWAALGPAGQALAIRALEDNDAYPFLEGLDAIVRTGPTGTNVGDLQVLLLGRAL